jgi:hypothetical protein
MGAAVLLRDHFLPWLFGASFLRFRDLVFPFGVGQLLLAQGLGFGLMLRVARRGRALLACEVAATISMIGLVVVLSAADGVTGAAWAITAGFGIATLPVTLIAWFFPARSLTGGVPIRPRHANANPEPPRRTV